MLTIKNNCENFTPQNLHTTTASAKTGETFNHFEKNLFFSEYLFLLHNLNSAIIFAMLFDLLTFQIIKNGKFVLQT